MREGAVEASGEQRIPHGAVIVGTSQNHRFGCDAWRPTTPTPSITRVKRKCGQGATDGSTVATWYPADNIMISHSRHKTA
ncbi:hypothetical protein SCOR_25700 [Sulfidibacter corallicola]